MGALTAKKRVAAMIHIMGFGVIYGSVQRNFVQLILHDGAYYSNLPWQRIPKEPEVISLTEMGNITERCNSSSKNKILLVKEVK